MSEWYIPVDDLVEIYARIEKDVSEFVVRYCTMRGLAALRSELALGSSLFFPTLSPWR